MTEGATAPPQRPPGRPPARRPDRLHTVGAGAVAVLAVLAGILVVNLLNGPSDPDDPAGPVAAPSQPLLSPLPTPDTPSPTPSPRHTPSATPSNRPSATPTPAPKPSTTRPPAPPPASRPTATVSRPVVVLNDSRIAGLADAAAAQVEAAGFPVERVGNYVSIYNVPESTVFYDDGDADAARALQQAVPGIRRTVPRSETRIISTGTLILVVTREFPADPDR